MSDFPAPPDFYQQYTDEAVANDTAPPPPPVPGDHFILYGQPMNLGDPLLSSLSEHGLPEMFNTENATHAEELQRLTNLSLKTFLNILQHAADGDIAARNAGLDELRNIFFNMHHLANEFRPHQAVETVKVMLAEQVKQREDLAAEIQRHIDFADAALEEDMHAREKVQTTLETPSTS
eukprot:m.113228 g.113228  ORF g.113228 m.113228 type:complete len:178 (+) comp15354_c0_seq3:343-876(+)